MIKIPDNAVFNIHELIEPLPDDYIVRLYSFKSEDGTRYTPISFFGYKYIIYPDLWHGHSLENDIERICYTYPHERHSRNIVLPSLRKDEVMIDVGSCYGSWTLPALAMGVNVMTIEPDSYSNSVLGVHIKINGFWKNCRMIPRAVGKHPMESIDDLVNKFELKRVDLIKIDVEGTEYDVLTGAKETINKFSPKLLVELHSSDLKEEIEFLTNICSLKYNSYPMIQKILETDKEFYHVYHYV